MKGKMEDVVSTMMMVDEKLARIRARTSNILRYRRLLKTELTELERSFILKRLTEEQDALVELADATFPLSIGPSGSEKTVAALV